MGAIVADALCLGSHYEYDAQKIHNAYGNKPIEQFMSPGEMMGGQTHGIGWGERNYHPGKKASGTTDYGDYNILVLEHLALRSRKWECEVFECGSKLPANPFLVTQIESGIFATRVLRVLSRISSF